MSNQKDADHDLQGWNPQDAEKTSVDDLALEWIAAKEAERLAIENRRAIEDCLCESLSIDQTKEGRRTVKDKGLRIVVTQRMNRTIDADLLQEIAAEHGLSHHLGDLFRWKPDINAKAWKEADESITSPLLAAITTKPGRPSFAIETAE